MKAYSDVINAYDAGRYHIAPFRKVRSTSSYSQIDLSYGAGVPIANYYASTPLVQTELAKNEGIFHGFSTSDKFLHKLTLQQVTGTTGVLTLCDYLSYIPFIDGDSTDVQTFYTHALPRFNDGVGVQMFILSQGQGITSGNAIISYTNQDGISGQISTTFVDGGVGTGQIAHIRSSFIQLQQGDTGIRSIESLQFSIGIGGIYALVFVKPIASVNISDISAPIEVDFFTQKMDMPKVHKDAYLNFTFKTMSSVASTIMGQLEFIW